MTTLSQIDLIVVVVYAIGIFGLAQWVSRERAGHAKDSSDYFLASKALPWWAIGASLIAANISAEQIVGMSGSGYAIGLAIASYEWMAALTLLIVGKFFLPIFLANRIYTMPQFLEQRYGRVLPVLMAVFWLALYVFVNLTSIIWLGSIAVNKVAGVDQDAALIALGLFALLYQLYGGLKAVALTDIVQVTHLVLVGRIVAAAAIVIALLVARPLLGKSDQAFQFIQESSGFFTPGITVIFLLGLFWKRASEAGAIVAAVGSVLLSYLLKVALPALPFMDRMGLVFLITLALAVAVSLAVRGRGDANRVSMAGVSFRTSPAFNVAGLGVILVLVALYGTWW